MSENSFKLNFELYINQFICVMIKACIQVQSQVAAHQPLPSPSGVRIQSSKPVSKILRAYVRSINLDQNNQSLNLTEKQIQQQSHKFELLKCHCKDRQEAQIKEINDQAVENAIPENRTLINANLKDGDRAWIRRKQGARKSNGSGNGLSDKKKEKPKERIGDDDALSHVKQENGVQGKGKEREKSVDSEDDEGGTPSSETKPAKAPAKRKSRGSSRGNQDTTRGKSPQATRSLREREISQCWGNELWKSEFPIVGLAKISTGDNARLQGLKSLAVLTTVDILREKNLLTTKELQDLNEAQSKGLKVGLKGYPQIVKDQLHKAIEERRAKDGDGTIKNVTFGDIRNARDRLHRVLANAASVSFSNLSSNRAAIQMEKGKEKERDSKNLTVSTDVTASSSNQDTYSSSNQDNAPTSPIKKRIKLTNGKNSNVNKEGSNEKEREIANDSSSTTTTKDEMNGNGKREIESEEKVDQNAG